MRSPSEALIRDGFVLARGAVSRNVLGKLEEAVTRHRSTDPPSINRPEHSLTAVNIRDDLMAVVAPAILAACEWLELDDPSLG